MSVGIKDGSHDLILASDATASPTTSLQLMLATEQTGPIATKRWSEYRRPISGSTTDRLVQGPVQVFDRDPTFDLIFSQDDWSGGALQPVYRDKEPNKYATSNGMDMRWDNVATLGMKQNGPMDFLLRNGGAELGATTGWTANGVTHTTPTADSPRTGSYHHKLASIDANDDISQVLIHPEVYRGTSITVYAYAKSSGTANMRVQITDSAGTTNGTGVDMSTSYQLISATRTINSAATSLTILIDCVSETSTPNVFVDDITIVPDGGLVCSGMVTGPQNFARNGEGEINFDSMWTGGGDATGVADTGQSVNAESGTNCTRLYHTGFNNNDTSSIEYAFPAEVRSKLAGKQIVFNARGLIDSNCDEIKIRITDNNGNTEATTTTAGSFQSLTVTRTPASDISALKIELEMVADTTSVGVMDSFWDTLRVYVPGEHSVYAAFGKVIAEWDEVNDVWNAVYIGGSTVKSLVSHDTEVFAAFSDGTAYVYGSGSSWISSVLSGVNQDANFFVTAQAASAPELWKGILASVDDSTDGVYLAVNPKTGGSWGSVFKIGTADEDITGMYHIANTLVVGKKEGLFVYRRFWNDGTAANDFENLTLEYDVSPDAENFARGQESGGKLYLSAKQQALFVFDGSSLIDISSLLFAPRLSDFGGRVRAMAHDPAGLWFLLDTPTTDTTASKTTWLMELRQKGGDLFVYTMEKVSVGDINELAVNGNYLWALGRIYDSTITDYVSAIYRWDLPDKNKAPAFDATPLINTSGNFDTARWDGNLPDDDKAFISLTLLHKNNLDAEHTIVVKFGKDSAAPTTTTLGTANSSGTSTTFFFNSITSPESNAVGKNIQLNFALATDDTVSPELYGFILHSMVSPTRARMRDFWVYIGDSVATHNDGAIDPTSKATMISNLETLENQVYPIYITDDLDGDGVPSSGRWKIVKDSIEKTQDDSGPEGTEIWKFTVQEVIVS